MAHEKLNGTKKITKETCYKMQTRKAYQFFNCDEWKSSNSTNPFHNNVIYRDLVKPRKALWRKVREELAAGNIEINKNCYDYVRKLILYGDPAKASEYITYGTILELEIY